MKRVSIFFVLAMIATTSAQADDAYRADLTEQRFYEGVGAGVVAGVLATGAIISGSAGRRLTNSLNPELPIREYYLGAEADRTAIIIRNLREANAELIARRARGEALVVRQNPVLNDGDIGNRLPEPARIQLGRPDSAAHIDALEAELRQARLWAREASVIAPRSVFLGRLGIFAGAASTLSALISVGRLGTATEIYTGQRDISCVDPSRAPAGVQCERRDLAAWILRGEAAQPVQQSAEARQAPVVGATNAE